jgi:hypothetical protein
MLRRARDTSDGESLVARNSGAALLFLNHIRKAKRFARLPRQLSETPRLPINRMVAWFWYLTRIAFIQAGQSVE